ncbi:MAG: 50S ribosomal protein L9 [Candidatus Bipolaricaulota bacterium]
MYTRSEEQFDAIRPRFYNQPKDTIGVMIIAKVLLTTTIDKLGHVGEVVSVAPGYARNYLFPRGFAVEPTDHNVARFAKERAVHEAELRKREERAAALKAKLADQLFVFTRKAHDDSRLYGSVRPEDIAVAVESVCGEAIEVSRIRLAAPIETLGPHTATISLYKDISVEVRIRVDEEAAKKEE